MADTSGVEALPGESEADYVARQTRLREEAAARMRAKFGGSGGLNGRMGGVGSSGGFGSGGGASSAGGSALAGIGSVAGGVASAGLGIAAVGLASGGWLLGKAREGVAAGASTVVGAASNLRAGSSTGAEPEGEEEQRQDISDLLASARVDRDEPPAPAPSGLGLSAPRSNGSFGGGSRAAKKPSDNDVDIFAAAGLTPSTPPSRSPSAMRSCEGGVASTSSPLALRAGESPMRSDVAVSPVTVSSSGANGLSARKKPAAKKQDSAGWDDFDKW